MSFAVDGSGDGRTHAPPPADRYVFVVGIPRSGTHLVRQILNASPLVHIGLESRFLGSPKRIGPLALKGDRIAFGARDVGSDDGARQVVARIFEAARDKRPYANFWQRLAHQTDESTFLRALLDVPDRDARHVLELALRWAGRGHPVSGEKTPHHIFELDRLLTWYPQAVAIHVIRDPRAVYASARARAWTGPGRLGYTGSGTVAHIADFWFGLEMALRWRYAMALDREYATRYAGRFATVRFETLVSDPEPEVARLCSFVGVPFEEGMLRPSVSSSSFMREGAPGFRTEAVNRWRRELSPPVAAWVATVAGSRVHGDPTAGEARQVPTGLDARATTGRQSGR